MMQSFGDASTNFDLSSSTNSLPSTSSSMTMETCCFSFCPISGGKSMSMDISVSSEVGFGFLHRLEQLLALWIRRGGNGFVF